MRGFYPKRWGLGKRSWPQAAGGAGPRATPLDRIGAWGRKWRHGEQGTSAVEFALFAPVLFFALVAAVDLGLAEYERMTISHALRAGAQSAMADPGEDQVLSMVQNTASRNFTISDQPTVRADALTVLVDRFCACAENAAVAVACSTTCIGSAPTFIYYRLSAGKIHDGMILPSMTLSPSVQVQVR